MKNLFLSLALLIAMPIFSSQDNSLEDMENNAIDAFDAIVCVDWKVTGAGPDAYFFTSKCAKVFMKVNGGTLVNGTFCVEETTVRNCLGF